MFRSYQIIYSYFLDRFIKPCMKKKENIKNTCTINFLNLFFYLLKIKFITRIILHTIITTIAYDRSRVHYVKLWSRGIVLLLFLRFYIIHLFENIFGDDSTNYGSLISILKRWRVRVDWCQFFFFFASRIIGNKRR